MKELKTVSFHDKKIQQPTVEQELKEVAPPSDEFIQQVKEQLMILLHMYEAYLHQEIPQQPELEYCESYAFKTELPTSCQSDILSTHSSTSPVVNNNCSLSDFIKREERCSKFINQDLNFLLSSQISSVSKNVLPENNLSVQVSQSQTQVVSSITKLPTHTPENQNPTLPTQIVEPVLGFTPAKI